jgi:FtsP/CotA-like multicopper oxidase with cupredoxin domain
MKSRREFLGSILGVGLLSAAELPALAGTDPRAGHHPTAAAQTPLLVETPDVPQLPWRWVNGAKEFHLVAEPVKRRIAPGREMQVWGYNGCCPGPTIQANQGDRVRIVLENRLPESTSIHWHGLEIPVEMDGMPYISQAPVPPGGSFVYEFTLHQSGTFFYHSHGAMQEMMGLLGMMVLHPSQPYSPPVQHDYGLVLQEWALLGGSSVPNTSNMEFNWLTMNGKSAPDTTPLLVRLGNRVRIRIVNLGMDHHPIHLHGNTFVVTGSEAGRQPESTWGPANTVLVGVAQARDIEFDAHFPGDWMIHCHLPHHMMNNMSDLIADRMITPMALTESAAMSQMQTFANAVGVEHVHPAPVAPDANRVAGFPQDAFMEMGMDDAVARPENRGLPHNWSAGAMGMMTLLRVLPSHQYDQIVQQKSEMFTPGTQDHVHP